MGSSAARTHPLSAAESGKTFSARPARQSATVTATKDQSKDEEKSAMFCPTNLSQWAREGTSGG